LAELFELLPTLNKESARGATLVICSHVDLLLERILLAFMLDGAESKRLVGGFNAPLGTMASRANAARALALISAREFEEMETLRKVRNEFAHTVHCSFSESKVMALCRKLTMAAEKISESDESDATKSRAAFVTSGVSLIANLINREAYVIRHRLLSKDWPT